MSIIKSLISINYDIVDRKLSKVCIILHTYLCVHKLLISLVNLVLNSTIRIKILCKKQTRQTQNVFRPIWIIINRTLVLNYILLNFVQNLMR